MKYRKLSAFLFVSAVISILVLGLAIACAQRSRRVSRTEASTTITVNKGENLQAAIDKAHYGDTIVVEAGATFVGPLKLRDKGPGTGKDLDYITIQTSDLAGISSEGERISPAKQAGSLSKIVAPNEQAAVYTEPQAHHYKFVGLEFAPAPEAKYVYNLIDLGASDYSSLSQFPHHLIFDRCYVHSTGLNRARRGFALNSAETSVINSYVSGFAGEGDETQALAGWNGPGPFHIINNFLQAGGEILFFGGTDPSIPNLVPSDIEIRRNYMHRPAEWTGKALIKGSFELKNAKRVVVEGNHIDSEILTTALVITVRNQYGKSPWSTIEDLEIKNNIVTHAAGGINFMGSDNEHPSQEAKRIRITNNLFLNITPGDPHSIAYFMQTNGGESVTVEHNTVQQDGNIVTSFNRPTLDFIFRNNIVMFNLYGIHCEIGGTGCPKENLFCGCFPGGSVSANVIIDNAGSAARDAVFGQYPRNLFTPSIARVGFVNYAQRDFRLAANSSYRGRATDGKDPGVDMEALTLSGVMNAKTGTSQP